MKCCHRGGAEWWPPPLANTSRHGKCERPWCISRPKEDAREYNGHGPTNDKISCWVGYNELKVQIYSTN